MAPENAHIGNVSSLTGQATVHPAQGGMHPLADGDEVFLDDTITTANNSTVELTFLDGTIFAQSANSEVMLDVYVYDPDAGTGELLFGLAKGGLRAVSGEIVNMNPDGFEVETPLSTVGIRGTTFFVILDAAGQVVGVEDMDPSHVVVVENDNGEVTITRAGEFMAVQLDGFLADPTMFSPEFLEGVHNMAPFEGETTTNTELPGQQSDGQGGDIPDEVLADLTHALQLLQGLGDSESMQSFLSNIAPALAEGDGETDTTDELTALLGALEEALSRESGSEDDTLLPAQDASDESIDLKRLPVDTDGMAYRDHLVSEGYNPVDGTSSGDASLGGTANKDALFGLAGSDSIDGQDGDDVLFGGADNDTLHSGSGNDILYGGPGGDLLFSQAGSNFLVGGSGPDQFYIEHFTDGNETIRDFSSADDIVKLKAANFGIASMWDKLSIPNFDGTTGMVNPYTTTVYDPVSGKLWHDLDGTGTASSAVHFATLEDAPTFDVTSDLASY